ncbi:MAG: TolC family protein, partial [Myxococcota bacterium]
AFWGQLPDLQVSGSLRRARPNPRVIPPVDEFRGDWRVGAALSWSPTGFFLARAEAQSADAEVVQARLAVDQQRDLIRNEVAGGLERARSAAALRATAVVERRAAQEAYRVRRVQYPAGLSTLSDLVDAEAELVTAELRLLNATVQMALSQEELARTLGRVR